MYALPSISHFSDSPAVADRATRITMGVTDRRTPTRCTRLICPSRRILCLSGPTSNRLLSKWDWLPPIFSRPIFHARLVSFESSLTLRCRQVTRATSRSAERHWRTFQILCYIYYFIIRYLLCFFIIFIHRIITNSLSYIQEKVLIYDRPQPFCCPKIWLFWFGWSYCIKAPDISKLHIPFIWAKMPIIFLYC